MLYVDQLYIPQLAGRLRNFKRVKEHYNFSCPICMDSKKSSSKARAWFYSGKDGFSFKCYNCNATISFYGVFKLLDEELFKQYLFEKRVSFNVAPISYDEPKISIETIKDHSSILDDISCIEEYDETHPAVKYVKKRKIPREKWSKIYFAPKFISWCNSVKPGTYKEGAEKYEHPRLIFPFFDENGIPFGFAGRAFKDETPKYLTIKLDENKEKIYGLDDVDFSKKFYVTEGQVDSLFIPNAIASAGSSFNSKTLMDNMKNAVICYDNENRSKEIMKALENTINIGFSVFIWPDNIKVKDFNDLVLSGYPSENITKLIDDNTYSGMRATMRYLQWRKI